MGWVHRAWWSIFGVPLALALHFFVVFFATACIRLAQLPLAVWQAGAKPLSGAAFAPVAIALYWTVGNLLAALQQPLLNRIAG